MIARTDSVYEPGEEVFSMLFAEDGPLHGRSAAGGRWQRALPAHPAPRLGARALVAAMEREDVLAVVDVAGTEGTSMTDVLNRLGALEARKPMQVPMRKVLVKAGERIAQSVDVPFFSVNATKLTVLEERNAFPDLLGSPPAPLAEGCSGWSTGCRSSSERRRRLAPPRTLLGMHRAHARVSPRGRGSSASSRRRRSCGTPKKLTGWSAGSKDSSSSATARPGARSRTEP